MAALHTGARGRTSRPPPAPDNDCGCHDTFTDLLEDCRDWRRRRVQLTTRMDAGELIELSDSDDDAVYLLEQFATVVTGVRDQQNC